MPQHEVLVDTLKTELKKRKVTYGKIAEELEMSEANVKRMFAQKNFSLQRLDNICNLIGIDIIELVRLYEESRQRISYLTIEQEKELVADIKLLMVAVCVRNHNSLKDIIGYYEISEHECIRYLAHLDRLHLIELLPGNRIKLLIDENFHWLPKGPITVFFEKNMLPDFLNTNFSRENEYRIFLNGAISKSTHDIWVEKLKHLSIEFKNLVLQDKKLPMNKKENESLMIAFRPWQYKEFEELKRK